MTFRAFLSRDGASVLMIGQHWRRTIPVGHLDEQRRFYRRLWGRKAAKPGQPGPYAKHYEETCHVLDALAEQIKRGAMNAQADKG